MPLVAVTSPTVPGPTESAAAPSGRPTYRADIEGLRAVAVLLVVAYHAGLPIPGGFIGVDVFFVLSGFLITGLLLAEIRDTGRVSLRAFYGRRIRRLLPLSTVVLLTVLVVTSLTMGPLQAGGTARDVLWAGLFVSNWHFAGQALDYFANATTSPVLHYWSLSVEEQYYVVWPLLLLAAARTRARSASSWTSKRRRITVALSLLVVLSLFCSVALTGRSGPYAYFGLHSRAWELGAGALLAVGIGALSRLTRTVARVVGWCGAALLVIAAVMISGEDPYPGWRAVLPVAATVLLVAAGARGADWPGRLVTGRQMLYVGRISYGWYLWHWPCLILGRELFGTAATADVADFAAANSDAPRVLPWWGTVLAVGLSLALAAGCHALFEERLRRSRWLSAVTWRSLAFGTALVAAVVVCSLALTTTVPAGATVSIAAADGQTKVRLVDTPAVAAKDSPTGLGACHASIPASTVADKCQFGDPNGTRTVALVGDSIAQQWFPVLNDIAVANHWRLFVWTKSACPAYDVRVWIKTYSRSYDECTTYRTEVLQKMTAIGHFDAVITSRSSFYHRWVMTDATHRVLSRDVQTQWAAAWERTVEGFGQLADNVILLRDTPTAARDIPTCLEELAAVEACGFPAVPPAANPDCPDGGAVAATCGVAGGLGRVSDGQMFKAESAAVLPAKPRVTVISMNDKICPAATCMPVTDDGVIIYRDRHHLTVRFTRTLAAPLTALLRPLVGK
ncbi:MAG: acyltransferase 3 [Frankiales bacterium]|nr:acyltransferase 3 [Frankiales bacterium]